MGEENSLFTTMTVEFREASSAFSRLGITTREAFEAIADMEHAMRSTTEGMWRTMTVTTPTPEPEPARPPAKGLRTLIIRD